MRMHRGSSKGAGAVSPAPEPLPLSASGTVEVEVYVARGAARPSQRRTVRAGTPIKELLRSLGEAPEGSAVLVDGVSVPLDTPLDRAVRLVVVPTFSGG